MLYSCIVVPLRSPILPIKEEDSDTASPDYYLQKIVEVPQGFNDVYLRMIRFNITHYNKDQNSSFAITIPYQIHLASTTLISNQCEFRILQNTMHLKETVPNGNVRDVFNFFQLNNQSTGVYSTLCMETNNSRVTRQKVFNEDGNYESTYTERRYFEMPRDVHLGHSDTPLRQYRFELFFTDLNGQRYNILIPNVEIELDFV